VIKIICDTRDKPEYRWTFDEMLKDGEEIDVRKLDTGDYSIEGLEDFISIDRKKSVNEIISNISGATDRIRFRKELDRAKGIAHFFIMCEFSIDDVLKGSKFSKVSPSYILSALAGMELTYPNLSVHYAGSSKNAEILTYRILSRAAGLKGLK